MEIKLREMSYGLLLSHTFPGVLLTAEILLAVAIFTPVDIVPGLKAWGGSLSGLASFLLLLFVSASLLGFVLDGIHHFVFRRLESVGTNICEVIGRMEQMQIYRHFVEDDLWYPYEAYANIAIAMVPGLFLLPSGLSRLSMNPAFIFLVLFVYSATLCILFCEARRTLIQCNDVEQALYRNFSGGRAEPPPPEQNAGKQGERRDVQRTAATGEVPPPST